MKVALAILNRNDLAGAKVVLPQVDKSLFDRTFVIDGGSTDGSLEYFKSNGYETHVLTTGGRGGAMRFALDHCGTDYIVFLSTDGEENPQDLSTFLEKFRSGADLVIASRLAVGGHHKAQSHIKWIHRLWYLKLITLMINILFKAKLTDCWNGYRGGKVTALKKITTDATGYLIEAQQTIRFLKSKLLVQEFPTREGDRIGGQSGNPVFSSGWQHLVLIARETFKRP